MRSTPLHGSPLHAMQAKRAVILARQANDLCVEIAAARVLDAINQNRPQSFEDVAMIELYLQRPWMRPATD